MASKRGASNSKAKNIKPSRVGREQFSSWQTPEALRQLRILAAEEGTTSQALVAEALNLLFAKRGKSQLAQP